MCPTSPASSFRPRNLILAQLPEEEYAALAKSLVPVQLPLAKRLYEPNQSIDYIYFLNTGIVSIVSIDAITARGEQVEVGIIGREGIAGLSALFSQPELSHISVIQGIGEGLRIRASVVRVQFLKGGVLRSLIHAFTYLQIAQITQSVLCNRMHEVDARLARWLLISADRMESETVNLTQEFLSQMLGVQRSTVTTAAGDMQRQGLIAYSRGCIHILDRSALAAIACECYAIVNASYRRVIHKNRDGQLAYALERTQAASSQAGRRAYCSRITCR